MQKTRREFMSAMGVLAAATGLSSTHAHAAAPTLPAGSREKPGTPESSAGRAYSGSPEMPSQSSERALGNPGSGRRSAKS